MSKFSLAEITKEPSVGKVSWKGISKMRMNNRRIVFLEDANPKEGMVRGNPEEAARFFKSKLRRSFTQSK